MVAGGALRALLLTHDATENLLNPASHNGTEGGTQHAAIGAETGLTAPLTLPPRRRHGLNTAFDEDGDKEKEEDELDDEEAMDEHAQKMATEAEYVKKVAKEATRATERAASLAEQVRLETLDEEISRTSQDLQDLMRDVPWQLRAMNPSIQRLYDDREALRSIADQGGSLDPFVEKHRLASIERHATDALAAIEDPMNTLRSARILYNASERHAALAPAIVHDGDVRFIEIEGKDGKDGTVPPQPVDQGELSPPEALEKTIEGQPDRPEANTSAGCNCDPQVACSLQGRSFTWCRVGGGTCPILQEETSTSEAGGATRPNWIDASGTDHRLFLTEENGYPASSTRQQQSGAIWDYCTPAPKRPPKAPPKTAHGGRCAWRGDLYERYERDDAYDAKGMKIADESKIPKRDRLAVEAMRLYKAASASAKGMDPKAVAEIAKAKPAWLGLCRVTEHSKPYAVCPVVPDPDNPEASHGGWLSDHSWDFCADTSWHPAIGGDKPPKVPYMKTMEELRAEEQQKAAEAALGDVTKAAGPSPLVALAISSLRSPALGPPPPRSRGAGLRPSAKGSRPAAPPARPPRSLQRQVGPAPSRNTTQRLSSFLPALPEVDTGVTTADGASEASVMCRQS
jgi:hypothetical protein